MQRVTRRFSGEARCWLGRPPTVAAATPPAAAASRQLVLALSSVRTRMHRCVTFGELFSRPVWVSQVGTRVCEPGLLIVLFPGVWSGLVLQLGASPKTGPTS